MPSRDTTIDRRLKVLQDRLALEGRGPTPAERAMVAAELERRKDGDIWWAAKQERIERKRVRDRKQEILQHKRYFKATGQWRDGASRLIHITARLETMLRAEAKRRAMRGHV